MNHLRRLGFFLAPVLDFEAAFFIAVFFLGGFVLPYFPGDMAISSVLLV